MPDETLMQGSKEAGSKGESTNLETEKPLESWKEIAVYLNRDTRTVRRWEKSEGLPVHRHLHQARSTVYAYPSELDAWRAARRPAADAAPAGWLWTRPVRIAALAAMLLLTLATAGGGGVNPPLHAADGPAIVVKRVWSGAIDDLGGPSPDGRYLSFVDWSTGDLAIRDLTTGENKRLTNKGTWSDSSEYAEFSVFSPDGLRIAFAWFNPKTDNYELRVVGRDGSNPRVLHAHPETFYVQPVNWTPDGKKLIAVFSRQDRTNQIVAVNDADGTVRVIKSFDWRYPRSRLSPDGRWIAYDFPPQEEKPERDIFLLATDGTRESRLVEHPAHDFLLSWTPEGDQVLFGSDRTGTPAAWALRFTAGRAEGSPVLVRQQLGRIRPIGITRAGAFYYSVPGMRDVYTGELDVRSGRLVVEPHYATERFQGSNAIPMWSPDGKYLAFFSTRGLPGSSFGSTVIVLRSVETGEERELVPRLNMVVNPNRQVASWAPDGRSFLVMGRGEQGRTGIYAVDAQTAETRLVYLPLPRREPRSFAVLPDGRTILVRGALPGELPSLRVLDPATGNERTLHSSPHIHGTALSPDGRYVAFSTVREEDAQAARPREPNANRLIILPVRGGEPREILRVPQDQEITAVAWTPDQRYLLLTIQVGGSEAPLPESNQVWRLSVEGGKPVAVNLTLTQRELNGLRFHPRGRKFAYTHAQEGSNEIWVMENFLPAQKDSR